MTGPARERLFGYSHAFDHPSTVVLVTALVIVLAGAGLAMVVLKAAGRIKPELWRELVKRYLAWAVMAPLVVGPILAGAAWAILMVGVMSILCYREFARATGLFREKAMSLMVVLGIIGVTLAALDHWYDLFVALPPLMIAATAAVAILSDRPKGYIQRVGLATLSFLVFGVCLAHLGYLANDTGYRSMMLLLLISVAMNDVFAFVVGKSLGGPKLAPNTSPNKTASGSVGALILSTGLFYILGQRVFEGQPMSDPRHLIMLGAIVSLAGQLGDLAVSSVKRDVGIKDMGVLIPGHGGVLDRCNSLLLAAPAYFHYVGYVQGVGLNEAGHVFTGLGREIMEDWKLEPAKDSGLNLGDRLRSMKREAGLIETAGHIAFWTMIRTYLRLYHRMRIINPERIPTRPPFVMVSNHASHLDAMVLAAPLSWRVRDRAFPIAAADVFFENPAATVFAAVMVNALPMWRKNRGAHAIRELRDRLTGEPCAYILFPEGARSRDGNLLRFKSGLGMIVAGSSVPVVPCYLDGPFAAMPAGRNIPRPKRITMHVGEPIVFDTAPNDRDGWDEVARRLTDAVTALKPA